ncbi:temperature dependent virulence factor cellobiohydrolase ChbA [Ralstonia pseudosolanacearum]|uniref:temperature dependent virulence factor cellobiohydrolase ChbA n=1 Tax=Ralstonia pseudosolanacearum TaxID=1310165 RepID=UPI002005430B|nr:temperature dependent virulence factor cellobiohydrolase ChbA [Ralstonia pseudosolanacearum]
MPPIQHYREGRVNILQSKKRIWKKLEYVMAASLLAGGALSAPAVHAEAHVDNPFVGATAYVNPDYAKEVNSSIAKVSNASLKAKMEIVKSYPTSVWLDSIGAIGGGAKNAGRLGLMAHLDAALAQKKANKPITVGFVIYDIPGRDCHALASNGELPLTPEGLQRYKKEYIDVIAGIFANPKYKDIRIVNVIEPDGLPNLVTNLSDARCAKAKYTGIYEDGIKYALNKFSSIPNVYNYMDIAHSAWLGWDDNRAAAILLYTQLIQGTTAGFASVNGFATDTANVTPLVEPNLPNPDMNVGGQPIRSAKFYEWNRYFGEIDFAEALYKDFVAAGWPSNIGFLIDTGRNGWGGAQRPTASTGSDVNAYVNSGRVDRRKHRGNWCNQVGAGMGLPPAAAPGGHLDAFVWIKPAGESDGSSRLIKNNQGKGFDKMCDPNFITADGVLTGALPNAPIAGEWFHDQFVMLINNAYPAIGGATPKPTASSSSTPAPSSSISIRVIADNEWNAGSCERVQVTNTASSPSTWAATLQIKGQVQSLWGANWSQNGDTLTASGMDGNKTLAPNGVAEFGFCTAY